MNLSPLRRLAAVFTTTVVAVPILTLTPAAAVDGVPQPLPLTVADPGNTTTTVDGHGVRPVPAKFVTAANVKRLNLRVRQLAPAKNKRPVSTLIVTYRMGDVLPATTKLLNRQTVGIYLQVRDNGDADDFSLFRTSVTAPRQVTFTSGATFGGSECGWARTNFTRNVIRQYIPLRRCVGTTWSQNAIVVSTVEVAHGSTDPMAYRAASNRDIHTGPLSYRVP